MLSLPHIIILFVVALVVFGPDKLPELARNLGKWTAEFRRMTGEFRSTFEGHMRDLEREADERRKPPVAAPAPAPTENTIGQPSAEAPSEPASPSVTPAEGIVRATDPRIPPAPEASERFPESSPEGIVEASADAEAAEPPSASNYPGEPPEPVTDGQHHSV
jgi:TatA/E family protein of Tat protein translocase